LAAKIEGKLNSLKIDFQKTQKSKMRFYLGILMLLMSAFYLFLVIYQDNWYNVFNVIIFFIWGTGVIIESKGFTLSRLWGEAYLLIDDEKFEFKPKPLKPASILNWNKIDTLKFRTNRVEFIYDTSTLTELEYSRFSYQQVQDIKAVLTSIAEKNNITVY